MTGAYPENMSERAWEKMVLDLATYGGWMHYHPPDNMPRTGRRGKVYVQNVKAGFPDLFLIHRTEPHIIIAELKAAKGKIGPAQQEWLDRLSTFAGLVQSMHAHGRLPDRPVIEVHVWRPEDWSDVERILLKHQRDRARERTPCSA
jgi:hypothetical protein